MAGNARAAIAPAPPVQNLPGTETGFRCQAAWTSRQPSRLIQKTTFAQVAAGRKVAARHDKETWCGTLTGAPFFIAATSTAR
jgi:hypothetical protein